MRTQRIMLLGVVLVTSLVLGFAGVAQAEVFTSGNCYERGWMSSASAHWNGVQMQVAVQGGTISTSDKNAHGFIGERVWVIPTGDTGDDTWVEVGVVKGWTNWYNGNYTYEMTGYWADARDFNENQSSYWQHKITTPAVAAGNSYIFQIVQYSGNTWAIRYHSPGSDGLGPVVTCDDGSWYSIRPEGPETTHYAAGMESNCTSGRMGSSADWVSLTRLKKTSDHGGTWSFAPADYLQQVDPNYGPYCSGPPYGHASWSLGGGNSVQQISNYRADN